MISSGTIPVSELLNNQNDVKKNNENTWIISDDDAAHLLVVHNS